MIGMDLNLHIVLLIVLISVNQATIRKDFNNTFGSPIKDALGITKFQDYLGNHTQYNESKLSGENLLEKISSRLSTKFGIAEEIVADLRKHIEADYEDLRTENLFDCCRPPEDVNFTYNEQLNAYVNTDKLCYIGVGSKNNHVKRFGQGLIYLMKKNHVNSYGPKWQYVATEDGVLYIYPALNKCDVNTDQFDPRSRPWYVETVSQKPKNLVLLIDVSNGMSAAYGSNTYLDIVKEAAKTVIDTLNPNDKIGVVTFSSFVRTSKTEDTPDCFKTSLAQATYKNKNIIKTMIDKIYPGGGSEYSAGLSAAFDLLSFGLLNRTNKEESDAVILFVTASAPQDSSNKIMKTIHQRNSMVGNQVTIMTYGLGYGVTEIETLKLLKSISFQEGADESYGKIKKGVSAILPDAYKLRRLLGRYYKSFPDFRKKDMVISLPHVDEFRLGMVTSMCSPVVTSHRLAGVVCADLKTTELIGTTPLFKPSELSYTFIVDDHGRLLTHPLLPKLKESSEDPQFVHMLEVEREPRAKDILRSMLNGGSGNLTFLSQRIVSGGNSLYDGFNTEAIVSDYHWQRIESTNLSLCLVVGKHDMRMERTSHDAVDSFLYHRLDLNQPRNACYYFEHLASKEHSAVKFTPYAFKDPSLYTDREENRDTVKKYEDIMMRKAASDNVFKERVVDTVATTAALEKIWLSPESEEIFQNYTIWRYIGTENGVFRIYPGVPLYKAYDHTVQPWYRKALNFRNKYIFTPPHMDIMGSRVVISIAKAVYPTIKNKHQSRDDVFGVMGMDFSVPGYYALVKEAFPECTSGISYVLRYTILLIPFTYT